jgi:UPF0716 protein FxsA
MGLVVALGFVALIVAEIYVIIAVGQAIGALLTIVLLLGTSIVGGALVRRQAARAWARAAQAVQEGRAPGTAIADGLLIFVGGVLLFPPGFITDVIGLLLVLPFTRPLFRWVAAALLARRTGAFVVRRAAQRGGWANDVTVIDGDVVSGGDNRGPDRPRSGDINPPAVDPRRNEPES